MSLEDSSALSERVLDVMGAAIDAIEKRRSIPALRGEGQCFVFPGGIDSIQVTLQVAGVTATVAVSGSPGHADHGNTPQLSSHPMTYKSQTSGVAGVAYYLPGGVGYTSGQTYLAYAQTAGHPPIKVDVTFPGSPAKLITDTQVTCDETQHIVDVTMDP